MRLALFLAVALAAPACAQPVDKPAAVPDPYPRRADSVIARADDVGAPVDIDSVRTVDVPVPMGSGEAVVRVHTAPIPDALGSPGFEAFPLNALNLHDDEGTSVEAALDVLRERGGRVVELVHSGDRNVRFSVGGARYEADPNRMFTPAGRTRTLGSLSTADERAEAALAAFADSVLAVYAAEPPAVVLTLHNNTDANYSAASYGPGAPYASDAAAVTVHNGTDPDDFFFVTDRAIYDALVARGFNAVLQDNDAATDDGSLSVWAARRAVPYVNVEAQHGHREEQAAMLLALLDVLDAQR
ncbi:hypothetical protein [Rubrivirga marina]|uniref:Uncharacterized protein n=1 Tax=Rubrivirga marina TaxID=1196024 RepID=A0A271J2F7_9BACT|nr:hypothetical protein [Rubrivirga marina]PAP77540.1 hypothetical protein BSZ37_14365 [Rubrivirga marina]